MKRAEIIEVFAKFGATPIFDNDAVKSIAQKKKIKFIYKLG
jgi:hypothetical protein